jgi:membrane associated rhomboid family serine protease
VLPRFRRGAFAVFALGFSVTMLLGDRSGLPLSLRPSELLAGHQWWTPITALIRAPEGLGMLALLWTLLVQWVVGSRLEGFWGTARYLIMVLVAGLVGHAAAIGLALLMPDTGSLIYSGTGPLDAAAIVAFAWVFADERLELGSASLPTVRVAAVLAPLTIGFPMLVSIVAGTTVASAWPTLVPGIVAAAVATVFVQPWRRREKSGKVARENRGGQPHLRVVRTVDDLLN